MKSCLTLFLLMIVTTYSSAVINRIDVLKLPDMSNWEKQLFTGETSYELIDLGNKLLVIKATANSTASGLVREIDIDLKQTPYMNWSWKVDGVLNNVQETVKDGDDYAARVYVVISDGFFFWQTRALSYVWSSKQTEGSTWPNAFSSRATMVAVKSGEELVGEWAKEKRNILYDIKHLLESDVTDIKAIAIMTDADNSQQTVTAYYGDIYFTSE